MSRLNAKFSVKFEQFELNIELDLSARGVTVVFGPSGSGKTTLLRCLAGLEKAPGGFLKIGNDVWQDDSQNIFLPVHDRPIGLVFQDSRLFPHLSVRGNLEYGFKRTPNESRRISLKQITDLLDLHDLLDRRPHRLSGGEQQRVAIGRALLTSPHLLLMDEPLANLDARRKLEILPFLSRLRRELDIPIIYVSHSINEVLQLVDTLVLLEKGKVAACGPVNEVFSKLDLRGHLEPSMIGAVLETRVIGDAEEYGLSKLDYKGQSIYVPYQNIPANQSLRLQIMAQDVSIVLGPADIRTSVLNILEGTILEIGKENGYSVDIKIDVGDPILATITRKSLNHLGLKPGQRVFAHIKAVKTVHPMEPF